MISYSLNRINEIRENKYNYQTTVLKQPAPLTYPEDSYEFSTKKQEKASELNVFTSLKNGVLNVFSSKNNTPEVTKPIVVEYTKNADLIYIREATDRYIDYDNARILKELNPIKMEKRELPKDKELIEVSNFEFPSGTIMATTSLDKCLASGKFLQCAGVAIVDKAKNQQTLMHCFPGDAQVDVDKLLKHIIDNSSKDLDITIITGTDDCSENTISYLVDSLKELTPDTEVKFANFSKDVRIFNRAVILEDGKLSCCTNDELENNKAKITNPIDEISYIKAPYNS